MEQHTFSALITFDPSARGDLALHYLDGTRTNGIVELRSGRYFPAAVCCLGPPSPDRIIYATVRTPLLAGEAEIFFDPGQAFTIWADVIVCDDTVRGERPLCTGVVLGREFALSSGATSQEPGWPEDHRQFPYRRLPAASAVLATPSLGRGQHR